MQNDEAIIQRINMLIDFFGDTQKSFSTRVGIDKSNLSKILSGQRPIGEGVINKIALSTGVLKPWLVEGEGDPFLTPEDYYNKFGKHPRTLDAFDYGGNATGLEVQVRNRALAVDKEILSSDKSLNAVKSEVEFIENEVVPVYELTDITSLSMIFEKRVRPIDYIRIPALSNCDGAVRIKSDAMYPELKSGDIAVYKQLKSVNFKYNLFHRQMYLLSLNLDGADYVVLKYVEESDKTGEISLVSANPHYPPVPIQIDAIKDAAIIKACIRYNTTV